MKAAKILVVDDEPDIRAAVRDVLEDEGYLVNIAADGAEARLMREQHQPDLVLLDIWMPDVDGVSLLREWNEAGTQQSVVMMSGHGSVESAVEATRQGALNYIEKPLSLGKLLSVVKQALQAEAQLAHGFNEQQWTAPCLVGSSAKVKALQSATMRLAQQDNPIVIVAVTGSDIDALVRYLHEAGSRAAQPLAKLSGLSINAALPQKLAELSLSAGGGTLFIEHIDALSMRELTALEDWASKGAKPRLIVSSLIALESLLERAGFPQALYTRLKAGELHVSPLEQHVEDVPILLEYYVRWFTETQGLPYRHIGLAVQNRLRNHTWPGNFAELASLVQRLLVMGGSPEVSVDEVAAILQEPWVDKDSVSKELVPLGLHLPLREAREKFEREYLLRQLKTTGGSVAELAKRAGMERTHLYRKLRSLGIDGHKTS